MANAASGLVSAESSETPARARIGFTRNPQYVAFAGMKSILVVEDDDAYRRSLGQILAKFGFATVQAVNGREALSSYNPLTIDAVVLDIVMPDVEGIETLTKLRRTEPAVKVLAISGGGQIGAKDYLELATKLGAQETLEKPFTSEAFIAALQRVLDSSPSATRPA